jgi:hypothetical protein
VVVAEYRARRLRPKVMILLDANKNVLAQSRVVDLHEEVPDDPQSLTITKSLEPEAYGIDLSAIGF